MSVEDVKMTNDLITKKIDIKGYTCPMTFVYTKLALEELNKGDILKVVLDFPPAIKNVPENCKRQNLADLIEIREINKSTETYELILRRL